MELFSHTGARRKQQTVNQARPLAGLEGAQSDGAMAWRREAGTCQGEAWRKMTDTGLGLDALGSRESSD